jgi:DNA repair exonuclease SbcCD nuclease subunit
MILTADLHLTDVAEEDYRWNVFSALENALTETDDPEVAILGDICDRKDRHSAVLVNRLVGELTKLTQLGVRFTIIMGNHDRPMNGPPFWHFLNEHPHIRFFDKPTRMNLDRDGDLLLLPYSKNPTLEWQEWFPLSHVAAIFMHQTVTGVRENNRTLTNDKMPPLPADIPIYSGDIHTPQRVGPVTYVGAPHPVKFGDSYACRMLVIGPDYRLRRTIDLHPPRKCIAEISSIKELDRLDLKPTDQVRVRWRLPADQMDDWSMNENAIQDWQVKTGVSISSLEPIITLAETETALETGESPEAIMEAFAKAEGLSGDLLNYGMAFLKEPT